MGEEWVDRHMMGFLYSIQSWNVACYVIVLTKILIWQKKKVWEECSISQNMKVVGTVSFNVIDFWNVWTKYFVVLACDGWQMCFASKSAILFCDDVVVAVIDKL